MNAQFIVTASVTLCLLLNACATPNIGKDIQLNEFDRTGLVVFSMSIDIDNRYLQHLELKFSSSDRQIRQLVVLRGHSLRANDDWQSPTGRLVYIKLPVGNYQFNDWEYHAGRFLPFPKPVPFTVVAGKATYIGNLHFSVLPKSRAYKFEIRDMSDRDLPLLMKRLPTLRREQVVTKLSKADNFDQQTLYNRGNSAIIRNGRANLPRIEPRTRSTPLLRHSGIVRKSPPSGWEPSFTQATRSRNVEKNSEDFIQVPDGAQTL